MEEPFESYWFKNRRSASLLGLHFPLVSVAKKSRHEIHDTVDKPQSPHPGFLSKHDRHFPEFLIKPSSQVTHSFSDEQVLYELGQFLSSTYVCIKLHSPGHSSSGYSSQLLRILPVLIVHILFTFLYPVARLSHVTGFLSHLT